MAARVVDWGLALLVAALLLTGALTLFAVVFAAAGRGE
jgi:hypothetical protein